jgi:GT2 family glycosyltransferase
MELSIIIVNYNVKEYLTHCIESVYKTIFNHSFEIIVVDNNSSDGSVEHIKSQFPDVIIITNDHNAGFSRANNQGINQAHGKYIFLLNPDTVLKNNTLEILLEFAEKNDCFIIGPKLLNSDGSHQNSAWKFPGILFLLTETLFLHKFINVNNYPKKWHDKGGECQWLSGAALLFRKDIDCFFDENLFWMDDVDFCYCARAKGCNAYYIPSAEMIHHGGKSSGQNSSVVIPNQIISKLKFFKKHKSIVYFLLADLISFIFIISRLLEFSLLFWLSKIHRKKIKAYFYALLKFYRYNFKSDQSIS